MSRDPSVEAPIRGDTDPRDAARALAPLIRETADAAERERRLPARTAEAMAAAGLYRIAAPRSVGGGECDPRTQIETIEWVSRAGAAAGWNLMIGIETVGFLGAFLAPGVARSVFADPKLIVSGALNPQGRAREVEGGFRISGQWPFASGCHNAQYFWGQCVVVDAGGEPVPAGHLGPKRCEALIPAHDFEILDTWHVAGLRGSGSHDVRVSDVFVPHEHVTWTMAGPPLSDGPLFRFPTLPRLAYNKVGVSTGIARAAIDHFVELAQQSTRRGSDVPLRGRPAAWRAVGEAEAILRSARAFVLESVDEVWAELCAGRPATPAQGTAVHLACAHAATAAIRAVELVHGAAGSAANFESNPLERCMRDVRVVPQHITVSSQWIELAGRALLDAD